MNVTNDEILAVLILKERRIVNLEAQLSLATADADSLRSVVAELQKSKPDSTPEPPAPAS